MRRRDAVKGMAAGMGAAVLARRAAAPAAAELAVAPVDRPGRAIEDVRGAIRPAHQGPQVDRVGAFRGGEPEARGRRDGHEARRADARLRPARLLVVATFACDIAEMAQRDEVLGVGLEGHLERRLRVGEPPCLEEGLSVDDEAVQVVGLLAEVLLAEQDGAVGEAFCY